MTKEELKALGLTDEQAAKIAEDYEKNYVAKGKLAERDEELKAAKEESKTVKSELEKLKKDHKDNAELVKQLEEMKAAGEAREKEHAEKLEQMQFDALLEKTLVGSKAKNTAAVKALLDTSTLKRDGETIKGLDDQLKKIKESDAYLFEEENPTPQIDGLKPGSSAGAQGETLTIAQQFGQALGI